MSSLRSFSAARARPRLCRSARLLTLLTVSLVSAPAWGQGAGTVADPVLVQLGSTRERASFVMERFEIAVRGVASSQGLTYDAALLGQLYGFLPTFLDQRATELVLLAQARARGIVVDERDVDAVVARLRTSLGGDDEAYQAALAAAGFRSEAQLRLLVQEAELVRRTLAAIREAVVVTADEVTIAYHAQRLRFATPAEACARHILVSAEEQALELRAALEDGASFAELAVAHSSDRGSAVRGGELGCVRQGLTVPAFDAALFTAPPLALVGPVATQFGFHLIEVYELRPARVQPLAQVRAALEEELRDEREQVMLAAIVAASGVRVYPQFIPPLEEGSDEPPGV
jgi:peptidyl-prolyl cis-trans isomerase C